MDFTKLNQHTRLCRWMVYSRATTSAMALRPVLPAGFLPVCFAVGAIVCEDGVSRCPKVKKVARAQSRLKRTVVTERWTESNYTY
jgi:hypothetical protein